MRMMREAWMGAVVLFACTVAAAVPQLKGSLESAGGMGLKVKSLAGGKAVPAITLKTQRWGYKRGEEKWTETHYDVRELWLSLQRGCEWR